jgi:hypothetical protein
MGIDYANIPDARPGDIPDDASYDQTWGYYTAHQSVAMDYDGASEYLSATEITVNGVFTRNKAAPGLGTDIAAMEALYAKLKALEDSFSASASSKRPADPDNWGTAADPTCVRLPSGICAEGYAKPLGLEARQSSWASYLSYSATLESVQARPAAFDRDGESLDSPTLSIVARAPVLSTSKMAASHGEHYMFLGWSKRKASLSFKASFPGASGEILPSGVSDYYGLGIDGLDSLSVGGATPLSGYLVENADISGQSRSAGVITAKFELRQL